MKVILQQDIKGSGKAGDIIEVKEGYARNFLFPKNLAKMADAANVEIIKQKKKTEEHKKQAEYDTAKKLASEIDGLEITIIAKAGANGKLFGSITSKEIADTLAQKKHKIDKRKIVLDSPIRNTGHYDVEIKVYAGITAKIKVDVVTS